MDSGLGVRWPLSPYTTALAAGAFFTVCIVFWKHRLSTRNRTVKDPCGRNSGKVDPNEERDESEKSVQDKSKAEKKRTNFPVLTFRELNPRFNCESTTLRSPFRHLGAIPRRVQRSHTLEDSQLFTALRRRTGEKGNKNCQELSRAPSNFSCIYQQSICFGSEIPSLSAKFELNVSPYLHQYLRQFNKLRDIQLPQFSSKADFKNLDVLINPEILKDKPITRSALSLTLDRQLHKILNDEPICGINSREISVQTIDILEEEERDNNGLVNENVTNQNSSTFDDNDTIVELSNQLTLDREPYKISDDEPVCEIDLREESVQSTHIFEDDECCDDLVYKDVTNNHFNAVDDNDITVELSKQEYDNRGDDSSLWDSGYCDKSFDERHKTSKGLKKLEYSELPTESEIIQCIDSKIISQEFSDEKSPDQSLSVTSEESNETVKFISDKLSDTECEHNDDFSFSSNVSEITNSDKNHDINNDINDFTFNENTNEATEFSLENSERNELCYKTPEENLNTEENLSELPLENEEYKEIHINEINLNTKESLSKHLEVSLENIDSNEIYDKRSAIKLNSEENLSKSEELFLKRNESSEINNENCAINLTPEENLAKPEELLLTCDKLSKIWDQSSTPNLNFENYSHPINTPEAKLISNLNKIRSDSGGTVSESKNEAYDIINQDTGKLTDFNAGVMQILQNKNENLTCMKEECGILEARERESDALHLCREINPEVKIKLQATNNNFSDNIKTKNISKFCALDIDITILEEKQTLNSLPSGLTNSSLDSFQEAFHSPRRTRKFECKNLFKNSENISLEKKIPDCMTRVSGVDAENTTEERSIKCSEKNLKNTDLERIQKMSNCGVKENNIAQSSAALESEQRSEKQSSRPRENAGLDPDVIEEKLSRDPPEHDEEGAFCSPRQMDRETGERSVAVESTVTTETTLRTNGDTHLSTALVSRLTLDDWSKGNFEKDSLSVRTTISEEIYKPTFDEFVPLTSSEKIFKKCEVPRSGSLDQIISIETKNESNGKSQEVSEDELPSSPRVDRLKGLLSRDEERRARSKFHHLADSGHVGGAMEGEWDRLLRDVLASVSELERWERRHCDVSTDAEDAEQQHHFSQSDSSFTMEEEALSPTKGETPTKVKNLRFKLDPDVFDVPSDDSFYDDDDDDTRRCWRKQSKYRAFSSLELNDEPVRLVSVHASVVPAGQKMVARPVGIDLRVRLTEERQSKRAHVSTSPSQAKRRSPVSDRGVGWCQELSPVTENVDWRETFTPVASEPKSVPNGILKTPSPKSEPTPIESPNPFKLENGITTNGVSPVIETKPVDKSKYNGLPWKPNERKPFSLPRKKFEPDPEAIERITGYKIALSKPPLPPPVFNRVHLNLISKNKAEQARKQYLDSKAALAASKVDGTKKFQQFLNQAQNDRARIVTSVPDLAAIERAVTEQWVKERGSVSPRESPAREDLQKSEDVTPSRGSTPDDAWASYVQSCRQHLGRRSQSMTYLETDIDIIPILDEDNKCHSISALDEPDEALPDPDDSDIDGSREDLDDSGRAKSEHELRIERSLRSLPVPEWYSRSEKTKTGFLLGNSVKEKRGWAAAKSLASSTSSLASCGLRRPVRSLRSSRENIPWSRSSASPDGPTLSLALAKAFREPYLGWRARTPTSSGVSSSPRASPPSWGATTTDDEANGVSFDGEDAFGRTISSEEDKRDEPLSLDDTGADAVTVSMDTNDPVKLPGGEDTCDDINNMSMDTCELFDASVVVPVDEDPSPQADTGDDIDNLSTDTTTNESRKLDPKLKRYSYSQSIYHSEWDEEEESRGDHKGKTEDREPSPSSPDHKVVWIESSFVGSRTTTSIMVLPQKNSPETIPTQERPASR